jgi:hypothetical protein
MARIRNSASKSSHITPSSPVIQEVHGGHGGREDSLHLPGAEEHLRVRHLRQLQPGLPRWQDSTALHHL